MDCWKVHISCPVCNRGFTSNKAFLGHLRRHSLWERLTAPAAPAPPLETGDSSSGAAAAADGRCERPDLFPWQIRTRKRGSHSRALVAVEVGEPSNPPPPEKTGMELAICRVLDVKDLPPKKRILIILQARNQHPYVCSICGRAFASSRALGGHKAHHTIREKKRRARVEEEEVAACLDAGDNGALVVYEPPPPQRSCGARQCLRCGRAFSTGQGLGGHKRHCKGPPGPAESDSRAIQFFDLNELPPPEEEEEEILALPWYEEENCSSL